jgi:hypothetical protein
MSSSEAQALAELDMTQTRTLGITAVSAVAFWYQSRRLTAGTADSAPIARY